MPFAIFRRHQRKMIAVLAVMAMFVFVLADSLPRLLDRSGAGPDENPVVAELYGESIRRFDLREIEAQRINANRFMMALGANGLMFGDNSLRSLVDAYILDKQADDLGLPGGPEVARAWLTGLSAQNLVITKDVFELALTQMGGQVGGTEVLESIAAQLRLNTARDLLGATTITPLDVFQTYRDQTERVAVRAATFPVDAYLKQVPEPTAELARASFEKSKNQYPDPARPTPGFKIPEQVALEVFSIDGAALDREIRPKVAEAELRTLYENRKGEFAIPSELPDDIFNGAPSLPPFTQNFDQVRAALLDDLVEDKVQTEINARFGRVRDDVLIPFVDRYIEAVADAADAAKDGKPIEVTPPRREDLAPVAARERLEYEVTPRLTKERAALYGRLGGTSVGLTPSPDARKFADEVFDPKIGLFEPTELNDPEGRRYLARKVEILPPRVPTFEEVRSEVILAWKAEQARPLAKKAAEEFAEAARKDGGKFDGDTFDGRPYIRTTAITRMRPEMPLPGQMFGDAGAAPSPLPEFPNAGEPLRDAVFGVNEGEVRVVADIPETVYYAVALDRREPATFDSLYGPLGPYATFRFEAESEARRARSAAVMAELRTQAGLPTDWIPPDEANKEGRSGNDRG